MSHHFPLRYLISEFIAYYLHDRPHQGKGNSLLVGEPPPRTPIGTAEEVVCDERLGGLLKSYRRAA
jgi:hypothetical protein